MMKTPTPKAVRSPLHHAGAGDSYAKLSKLQNEFAPVLNISRVYVRHQGVEHFITGRPDDTLNAPADGPLAGSARYRWEDRGDGVLYGFLDADA